MAREPAAMSASRHAEEVPAGLYRQARRALLNNEPLLAEARQPGHGVQALSAGEAAALESAGLSTMRFEEGAQRDPLMRSIADYMALLETSYTTSEAAKYLKVDASRIRQRLREHSLFGIDYEGEKRLPRFQFERKQVIPGVREVIAALPKDLNPLDVAEWFLSPNPDLEMANEERPVSPREWLLSGEPIEAVVGLARGFE
jgi:hypothetical protein